MEVKSIHLTINGNSYSFIVAHGIAGAIPPEETLVTTLRERLNLTGTKVACEEGACGACTVLLDGKAVSSCTKLTVECDGHEITTIEGLMDPVTGELDPLQQAFIDENAFQCGFCTPGIIMAAKGLLLENPTPTMDEVKDALSGNLCRCISQYHVYTAVMRAAGQTDYEKLSEFIIGEKEGEEIDLTGAPVAEMDEASMVANAHAAAEALSKERYNA